MKILCAGEIMSLEEEAVQYYVTIMYSVKKKLLKDEFVQNQAEYAQRFLMQFKDQFSIVEQMSYISLHLSTIMRNFENVSKEIKNFTPTTPLQTVRKKIEFLTANLSILFAVFLKLAEKELIRNMTRYNMVVNEKTYLEDINNAKTRIENVAEIVKKCINILDNKIKTDFIGKSIKSLAKIYETELSADGKKALADIAKKFS